LEIKAVLPSGAVDDEGSFPAVRGLRAPVKDNADEESVQVVHKSSVATGRSQSMSDPEVTEDAEEAAAATEVDVEDATEEEEVDDEEETVEFASATCVAIDVLAAESLFAAQALFFCLRTFLVAECPSARAMSTARACRRGLTLAP
jgi:hypothetical protein